MKYEMGMKNMLGVARFLRVASLALIAVLYGCGGGSGAGGAGDNGAGNVPAPVYYYKYSGVIEPKPGIGTGQTYYVSTTGLDSNTGTTVELPFRTISKAIDIVGPGGVIEVMPGNYNENLMPRTPGTADAWITLRGYNGRPVIRGTGAGPTIYIYANACDSSNIGNGSGNADCMPMYWSFEGLKVEGSARGGGDGNAIKIDTPQVRLINNQLCCAVADVVKLVRTSNKVEIIGNEIWQDVNRTRFSDNAQGVDIVGADDVSVIGNYVHDIADIGIYAKGNSRRAIFQDNVVANIIVPSGAARDGHAIMLGQSTDTSSMVDGPYETYDGIASNNVVINSSGACIATASSTRVKIYNNSCYNTAMTSAGSINVSAESVAKTPGLDVEIYNNIVYGSSNRLIIRVASAAMTDYRTLKVDGNLYFVGSGGNAIFSFLGAEYDYAGWGSAYRDQSGSTDGSKFGDPLYSNTSPDPAGIPLALSAGSPALGAGRNISAVVPRDRLGNLRPTSGSIDIGAYER